MTQTIIGDARRVLRDLPSESVQCCVTSPPYWQLRDYHHPDQIGLERTVGEYIGNLRQVFDEVRRMLTPDGVCWVNIGDTFNNYLGGDRRQSAGASGYSDPWRPKIPSGAGLLVPGLPRKSMCAIPQRFVVAMLESGWVLRSELAWLKVDRNLPDRAKDRLDRNRESVFLFSKSPDSSMRRHRLPRRFQGEVWRIRSGRGGLSHPAVFPEQLAELCITAVTNPADVVLDPFAGSGTTGRAAERLGRNAILVDVRSWDSTPT